MKFHSKVEEDGMASVNLICKNGKTHLMAMCPDSRWADVITNSLKVVAKEEEDRPTESFTTHIREY